MPHTLLYNPYNPSVYRTESVTTPPHAWNEQPRREKCKYWFLYLIQKAYYVRLRYYVIQQTTISTTANGKSHEDIKIKIVLLIKKIKFRPV